ncbi:hypothetical protein PoB_003912700 [Plakobranchus ocellatus]|uniref:Uncharacterized protein n=1 Tax=Plakobranchus ocellatus TaxID=259542 RepID=A0AAV4AZB2_9GAST|nr:hypothetical protein PoB_003912700 [Plakobranchus ocellatus]
MLSGLNTANLKSAFIACHNHHPCSLASTLPTYPFISVHNYHPSALVSTLPTSSQFIAFHKHHPGALASTLPTFSQFIAFHNHHPYNLVSTLPTYNQPSFLARTTIHALWSQHCQLKVSLHCLPQPSSLLPGLYSAHYRQPLNLATTTLHTLWSLLCEFIVCLHFCHKHHPCSLVSTLPTYSQPSWLATTTIHVLWSLLCQLIVSLHYLPQPPSMLSGLNTANLKSAFITCHNHHPCSLASTLPSYSLPLLPAATTIRAPWPLLCQLIVSLHCLPQPPSMQSGLYFANLYSAFIACQNHHPCSLASTLPTYSQPSLLATTTIQAPWPLLCKLLVSLSCLPQPPSMLPGLYSANLYSAFINCHNHHPCALDSTLPTYGQPSMLATTTIRAPWPLLYQLIVSLSSAT